MTHPKINQPKKILIINIFGLGDVLFTTPLISNLKADYPNASIGYVCNRRSACIIENNPKVERIFIYERDAFQAILKKSKLRFVVEMLKFFGRIKKEKYDMVLDVSLSSFTSFFTWFIGIPQRISLDYKNRSYFATRRIPFVGFEGKHVVEHYLDFLKEIGVSNHLRKLELVISKDDQEWCEKLWVEKDFSQTKGVVALVPGGGDSWGKDALYKRWSAENYAKLADKIVEKHGSLIILLGGENEKELCQKLSVLMQASSFSLCGQTTIGQFAAVVKKCSLVVLNDGGPLHVSVAAGANTVSIFGPVDDVVYGPYPLDQHEVVVLDLPCRPCYRRFRRASCQHISCLNTMSIDQVLRKVEKFL